METKYTQQITNRSQQIQIAHSKFKSLKANYKSLTANSNHPQQIQIAHSNLKSLTANSRVCPFVKGRGYFFECQGYIVEGPYVTLKNVWKSVKRICVKFAHREFYISVFVLIHV